MKNKKINSILVKNNKKKLLNLCNKILQEREVQAKKLFDKQCINIAMIQNKKTNHCIHDLTVCPPLSTAEALNIALKYFDINDISIFSRVGYLDIISIAATAKSLIKLE